MTSHNLDPASLITEGIQAIGNKPSAKKDAEDLFAHALGLSRSEAFLRMSFTDEEISLYRSLIKRRASGEPFAYIVNQVDFFGVSLFVDERVLIPRVETELLAEKAAKILSKEELVGKTLWDLGTGSGCLGIALKKRFPELNVVLIEQSKEALDVALENAELNQVEVTGVLSSYFEKLKDQRFDFLISNPPYIPERDLFLLEEEVRDFEPVAALTSGPTGLECYREIARQAPAFASKGAKYFLEIGHDQGEGVKNLFPAPCRIEKDLSGHDRFLLGEFS